MRLIDADKLLEAFSNSEHIIETTSGLEVMEMLAIKEIIDNAPTYNQVGHKMTTAEGFITNPEWYKGDLISRDVLKNKLSFVYDCAYIESKSKEGIASDIIDEIDKAPTVSQPDFKAGYKQAILDGQTNFKRPRGEWIKIGELGLAYKCNKCEEISVIPENFCPNCGADMRKETSNGER